MQRVESRVAPPAAPKGRIRPAPLRKGPPPLPIFPPPLPTASRAGASGLCVILRSVASREATPTSFLPDGSPTPPLALSPTRMARVSSYAEAAAACRVYISTFRIPAANWPGGEIRGADGAVVATVAHDGTVVAVLP